MTTPTSPTRRRPAVDPSSEAVTDVVDDPDLEPPDPEAILAADNATAPRAPASTTLPTRLRVRLVPSYRRWPHTASTSPRSASAAAPTAMNPSSPLPPADPATDCRAPVLSASSPPRPRATWRA